MTTKTLKKSPTPSKNSKNLFQVRFFNLLASAYTASFMIPLKRQPLKENSVAPTTKEITKMKQKKSSLNTRSQNKF